MLTDVLSSNNMTANGLVTDCTTSQNVGRCRIKAVYYTASANGVLQFREGGATGPIKLVFSMASAASGLVLLPGEGILFQSTPHMTIVSGTLTGATVFYA